MISKGNQNKKLRGFSLLEVLIMLIIISLTIISAMSLVAKISVSIKNNELLEVINDTTIKSIELVKSPSNVFMSSAGVTQVTTNTSDHYFSIRENAVGKYLEYYASNTAENFTDCDVNNFYYLPVVIEGVTKNYLICIQVRVAGRVLASDSSRYYDIQIKVIYYLEGERSEETFRTFRYAPFIAV